MRAAHLNDNVNVNFKCSASTPNRRSLLDHQPDHLTAECARRADCCCRPRERECECVNSADDNAGSAQAGQTEKPPSPSPSPRRRHRQYPISICDHSFLLRCAHTENEESGKRMRHRLPRPLPATARKPINISQKNSAQTCCVSACASSTLLHTRTAACGCCCTTEPASTSRVADGAGARLARRVAPVSGAT